eukprot:14035540-Alexandrium_andersonii.AAC.1
MTDRGATRTEHRAASWPRCEHLCHGICTQRTRALPCTGPPASRSRPLPLPGSPVPGSLTRRRSRPVPRSLPGQRSGRGPPSRCRSRPGSPGSPAPPPPRTSGGVR